MTLHSDPGDIYRSIGVTPVINAAGSTTAYGGSKLRHTCRSVKKFLCLIAE